MSSIPNSIVERINTTKPEHQEQLAQGDPVLILGGPFEGYQAIFDARIEGSERVRLLIKFLQNQQVRIQVPAKMVKPKKK